MGRFARIASDVISIGALLVFPFFCIYLVVWQPNGGHATPGLALFLFVDLMLICFGLFWLMVGHREFYLHIYARAGQRLIDEWPQMAGNHRRCCHFRAPVFVPGARKVRIRC